MESVFALIGAIASCCAWWVIGGIVLLTFDKWARRRYPSEYTPESRGAFYAAERLAALARDNYTCQVCGRYPSYITHHIDPRSRGGSDSRENLMTVCPSCHRRIEPN